MWLLALAASQAVNWHRQIIHERPDCYTNGEIDQTKCPGKKAMRFITGRPHTGGVGDSMTKEVPILKIAAKAVNEHATLLPDYIIELHMIDSKCSHRPAVQATLDILRDYPIGYFHASFGPVCSGPVASVNDALSSYNLLQIAPHSRSSALQNGARYPNICRLAPTLGFVVDVVNDVLRMFGWSRIGLGTDGSGLSMATQGLIVKTQSAEAEAGTYPWDTTFQATHQYGGKFGTDYDAWIAAAEEIKKDRPPVIVFPSAYEAGMFSFACAFHKVGIKNGDGIQMVHAGAWFAGTWMAEQADVQADFGCTADEAFNAMGGIWGVGQMQFKPSTADHEITGQSLKEIRTKYFDECVQPDIGCHPDFGPYNYDGLALFAKTFHIWMYDQGHSLDELNYVNTAPATELHTIMKAQDFTGLTGQVAFFDQIDLDCERKGEFSFKQYNEAVKAGANEGWETFAFYSSAEGWTGTREFSWPDGSKTHLWEKTGLENIPKDFEVCEPGTTYDTQTQSCKPCEPGFESREGKDCTPCFNGFFAAEAGMGRCTPCAPGTFTGETGATACTACAAGEITPAPGMDMCQACEPGTYSNEDSTLCVRCPVGTYQENSGAATCDHCPESFITAGVGTSSKDTGCVCAPGTFWNRAENTCSGCPAEAFCAGGSSLPMVYAGHYGEHVGDVSTETLLAQEDAKAKGVYVASPSAYSSTRVYKCATLTVCPGETVQVPSYGFAAESMLTKENLRPGAPLEGSCMANREGIACGRCAEDMYGLDECKECGAAGLNFLAVFLGPPVLLGMYQVAKPTQGRSRLLNAFILASLCGMLVFFIQSLAVLGSIDVGWPPEMDWIFAFARLFLFDFSGLTFACWTGNTFVARYISTLVAPLMLILFTVVAFGVSKLVPSMAMEVAHTCSFLGMLFTAFYVTLVKHIMTFFECTPNPGANTPSTLQNYRDVVCDSGGDRDGATVPMIFGLIVYVIGFYLLNCYLAYVAPVQWNNAKFRQYCRFLVNRWRPDFWWWGTAVLTRNVLVASSGLFGDDPRVQLLVLTALVVIYAVLVGVFQPWVVPGLNSFEIIATLMLGLLGTVGLIFNSYQKEKSILVQLEDAWAKDAVAELDDGLKRFGMFILVIMGAFLVMFFGLLFWCLSALPTSQVEASVRKLGERQTTLFGEVKQVVESANFQLLLEAVIVHGTEYDRCRLDELLRKMAAVAFTEQGQLDSAFIRPPSQRQGEELKASTTPKGGAVVSA